MKNCSACPNNYYCPGHVGKNLSLGKIISTPRGVCSPGCYDEQPSLPS